MIPGRGGRPYASVPRHIRLEQAWAKEHLTGLDLELALVRSYEHERQCPTECTCGYAE